MAKVYGEGDQLFKDDLFDFEKLDMQVKLI